MGIWLAAIASSAALWLLATGSGGHSGRHLRLEPPGHAQAFFTGDSFFVTCLAGDRSGATRLTWQSPSARDITVSRGRVHVEAAPLNPLGLGLVFEDIRYEDRGTYSCSAIIDGAERRTHFLLTVYLSISFWGTPEQQTGKEGHDFMVICNVRADPTPIVSWYANGTLLLDSARYTLTEDGLYIRGLRPSDAGNYTCRAFVVTPHSSQMKDRNIVVQVHYRPAWHVPHMVETHGLPGTAANLTCSAHAQPPPVFEWFRERALLGNSRLYRIVNEKWKSTLQVRINESSVFGEYQCVVSNIMGENQRTISLLEGEFPSPPSFMMWSGEPGLLTIRLSPAPDDVLPVIGYRIQWRLAEKPGWNQARYHHTTQGTDFVLQDLSFETDYSVRAAAQNVLGFSNYSEELVQRTRGLRAETVVHGDSLSSQLSSAGPLRPGLLVPGLLTQSPATLVALATVCWLAVFR